MFAVIADQEDSRHEKDAVPEAITKINTLADNKTLQLILPPERTSGDEFQCLLAEPESVYQLVRLLIADGRWHIGIGVGDVETPLPKDVREARGSALVNAREAVESSKSADPSVVLIGSRVPEASDANAVLRLISAVLKRRTNSGWAAINAAERASAKDASMSEAADSLGITKQALSQRLQAANWKLEIQSYPTVIRILGAADRDTPHGN